MENRDTRHHGTGNGFLLGVIIGTIGTLLFTTKKGREILKEVSEKGLERFSDLEKALEQEEKVYDEIEAGNDYVETQAIVNNDSEAADEVPRQDVKKEIKNAPEHKASPVRKFFKAKKS